MCNVDVREMIKKAGVFHYQVADALGVSEGTFCKMLRRELPEEQKCDVYNAIARLKDGVI